MGGVDDRDAFSRVKQNGHSCWIILYPEGTRRSPGKLARVSDLTLGKDQYSLPVTRIRKSQKQETVPSSPLSPYQGVH